MSVSEQEILRIAKLALLDIPEDQIEKLKTDMNNIVTMVDKLKELDLDKEYFKFSIDGPCNNLREDVVKPSVPRDEIIKNAPESTAGCFFVPKVVD